MNTRQSNKLATYREVQVFLHTTTATGALTALPAKIATLHTLLTRIDDLIETQTRPLAGVLNARDGATNAAIDLALAIAGPVRSYAASVHRPELSALVDLARRDFHLTRRGERPRLAQRVLDAAQPLATELGAYGVTPAMLEELHARIEASNTAVDVPRTTAANKKAATAALATAFKAVDTLVKNEIDPMLAVLALTDPEAHARYRIAREIIHRPGTRSDSRPQPPNAAPPTDPASDTLNHAPRQTIEPPGSPGKNICRDTGFNRSGEHNAASTPPFSSGEFATVAEPLPAPCGTESRSATRPEKCDTHQRATFPSPATRVSASDSGIHPATSILRSTADDSHQLS